MTLRSAVLAVTMLPFSVAMAQKAPCPSTVTGGLQIEHFRSKVFPYPQTLRVWLPPGYHDVASAQRKYPVLYMFDGQNLFGGCTAGVPHGWRVASYDAAGRLPDAATAGASCWDQNQDRQPFPAGRRALPIT